MSSPKKSTTTKLSMYLSSKHGLLPLPFSFAVLGPNLFLFKFSKQEHLSRILDQITWNVNGYLPALQKWPPTATLGELSLKVVPFWSQVHGLPLCNLSTRNAATIGKGLGNLLRVDDGKWLKLLLLEVI
jgi:hypothetical protein